MKTEVEKALKKIRTLLKRETDEVKKSLLREELKKLKSLQSDSVKSQKAS